MKSLYSTTFCFHNNMYVCYLQTWQWGVPTEWCHSYSTMYVSETIDMGINFRIRSWRHWSGTQPPITNTSGNMSHPNAGKAWYAMSVCRSMQYSCPFDSPWLVDCCHWRVWTLASSSCRALQGWTPLTNTFFVSTHAVDHDIKCCMSVHRWDCKRTLNTKRTCLPSFYSHHAFPDGCHHTNAPTTSAAYKRGGRDTVCSLSVDPFHCHFPQICCHLSCQILFCCALFDSVCVTLSFSAGGGIKKSGKK